MFRLDNPEFERKDPEAEKLLAIMASFYTDEGQTISVVAPWINKIDIRYGRTARERWDLLLEDLAKLGRLRDCVEKTRRTFDGNPNASFLATLLSRGKYDLAENDGSGAFDPWEYLGLFDRTNESGLLWKSLLNFAAPPALNPILIGVLAEDADEHTYFIQQVNADILGRFRGGAGQQLNRIRWRQGFTAEDELRFIADTEKIHDLRCGIGGVIQQLGPALAGRSLFLPIRSEDLLLEGAADKLDEFLALWGGLGAQTPPNILYITVVRWHEGDRSLAEAKDIVAKAFGRAKEKKTLTAVDPIMLSQCHVSHFDDWKDALTTVGKKKIDHLNFESLKGQFKTKGTFRLAELKEKLTGIRIYI